MSDTKNEKEEKPNTSKEAKAGDRQRSAEEVASILRKSKKFMERVEKKLKQAQEDDPNIYPLF